MKKVVYLLVMLMFGFGFFSTVNAENEPIDITGETGPEAVKQEEPTEDVAEDPAEDQDEESGEESMEATAGDDEDYTYDETISDNPNTGLNDYVIYILPVLLIGGSALVIKRNSFN